MHYRVSLIPLVDCENLVLITYEYNSLEVAIDNYIDFVNMTTSDGSKCYFVSISEVL